jgi:hypothetical protein
MKRISLAALAALSLGTGLMGCELDPGTDGTDGGTDGGNTSAACTGTPRTLQLSGDITGDTQWCKADDITLTAQTYVTSGTLKIQAGTVVKGAAGSALIVTRDAKIDAHGTAAEPIVFTSAKAAGTRAREDWAGVVLLGRAPINVGLEQNVEGIPANSKTLFGGTDAAHSCGTLKYVRVEFTGFELSTNNELQGLTMGGCGTGTVIDYFQSHESADDGIEIFGGGFDMKHVVISNADDDGLDLDLGYRGRIQFLVVSQSTIGNNGFEMDNNGSAPDQTPITRPVIWNATLVGSKTSSQRTIGLAPKEGLQGEFNNLVVTGFKTGALWVEDAATASDWNSGALVIRSSLFWNNDGAGNAVQNVTRADNTDPAGVDETVRLTDASFGNVTNVNPNLSGYRSAEPLTGGATPPNDGFFDTTATFRGAIGATDWTAGWTAFPAN